ncbi:MAG: hypothetical protein JWL93_1227 [Hyphomicrobiales bacterium]|jgi:hypothetical protein|nr:hypothetical protein [Hyphomicrobiales bacterium]
MSNTSDTSSVLDTARHAAAEVGLDPTKLAQDVSSRIRDAAEAQKSAGAEKVLGVARAIQSAAGELEDESPEVARYVRSAASTLEGFTRDLNDRSVDEMTQAVVDMARRSPGLFFAGSVLAGFALFRFLNAAQNTSGSTYRPSPRNARGGQRMGSSSTSGQSGRGGYGSSDAGGYDAGSSRSSGMSSSASSASRQSSGQPGGGSASSAKPASSGSSQGGSGAGASYGGTSGASSQGGSSGSSNPKGGS